MHPSYYKRSKPGGDEGLEISLLGVLLLVQVFKICETLVASCSEDFLSFEMLDGLVEVLG